MTGALFFKVVCSQCGHEDVYDLRREVAPKAQPSKKEPLPTGPIDELRGGGDYVDELLAEVSHKAQRLWLELYKEPAWIKQEILRAATWLESNQQKKRKDKARFISNWLAKNPRPFGWFKPAPTGIDLSADEEEEEGES